ncbi:MAG: hypothetical protein HYZ49_17340 [Chloroflexi bacterium]|nr:hypothetical protein [Chloroflexota bacterium]
MNLLFALLQAIAIITSPASNETVAGVVNITGTASHPQFIRYEIAFAYDPSPTDTWFELQPPSETQITDNLLAAWDTTSISDGVYMIRLRVFASGTDTPEETIVRGIKIQNTAPPTAAPAATSEAATPTSTPVLPTATFAPTFASSPFPAISPVSPSSPSFDLSPYTSAFCNGVYLTFGVFIFLGLYASLRDKIRRPILRWLRRIISDSKKP